MNLPLLFGVLIYLFILISLTVWLTKYHQNLDRSLNLMNHTEPNEEDTSAQSKLNVLPAKDSATSGVKCTVHDDQGGAKTD